MTITLREIDFLTTDADVLSKDLISYYESFEGRKLTQADPLNLIFLAIASFITKQNAAINDAAKQNLLYYARNEVLDHRGAEWDTPRLAAAAAKVTLRLHLSVPLTASRIIEKGTLATSTEEAIFFASINEATINPGDSYIDINFECTAKGEIGNGFTTGTINTLVKPLPYINRVENITVSAGGSDEEEDEAFRNRVYLAPEKLSTAGSTGAYEYHAKSVSSLIADVHVDSPQPGHVSISVLLKNGELPSDEIIETISEKVNARDVRPLTDFVTVGAPETVNYDLDVVYYIDTNAGDKKLSQERVEQAIADYKIWQSSKIGRDINPSKLISDCINAGAKRIDVRKPTFIQVNKGQVATLNNETITFGGLEDE